MPEIAQRFPLPEKFWKMGVRRYGFHGLSYEYISSKLGKSGRTIIAHLGNGASLAATIDGKPIETTMGLTPTGGIMMGTRSGDLDPGLLLYCIRELSYDLKKLEQLVDREAGLKGVSGISSDMHELLGSKEASAKRAIDLFCYQVRKAIGSLAAVMCGLDTLVFTGGIGERSAEIRERVCKGLEYLSPDVKAMATDEDFIIAKQTEEVLSGSSLERP